MNSIDKSIIQFSFEINGYFSIVSLHVKFIIVIYSFLNIYYKTTAYYYKIKLIGVYPNFNVCQ